MAGQLLLSLMFVYNIGLSSAQFWCPRCPDGWVYFEESCYLFADHTTLDWTEADHFCFQHHRSSSLVAIETAEENTFLKEMCHRLAARASFWTAASDNTVEGLFMWYPSNVPLNYTDWANGQPDSFHGHDEDCVLLYGPNGDAWHDGPCSDLQHPICELSIAAE